MSLRIYVCHTFYHVYVACLKEFHLLHQADLSREKAAEGSGAVGRAHLMLSTMSNDFSAMAKRAENCPLFEKVILFDEKRDSFFPELAPLREDTGSLFKNMRNRIRFCKRFPELLAPYVPVDFKSYDEIYVFCDSDPVGYYLNGNKIYYHALEDGPDALKLIDAARYDNRGHFGLKAWMAKHGLIFIQDGYAKYCIDMEVNNLSVLKYPMKKHKECPRAALIAELTPSDRELLLDLFLADIDGLRAKLKSSEGRPQVMILTEPLCDLETRERIFRDLIRAYDTVEGQKATVLIKPHPRDVLDYEKVFADEDIILLGADYPMEMLNYIGELRIDLLVSVFTVVDELRFAKKKIFLGPDFMDQYEEPSLHRQNDFI
ncbi:MAG: lipooligosaccharide sialyltransferase [Lachnospiraceae bacterium]|nr:lipooligosaccharide sialyltransferase [Lachnospiraceae bacterium]